MTDHNKKSLPYRLYQAFNAIGELEKKGKNETAGYSWLRASDVAEAFRREFKKRHIFLTSDEKEVKGRTLQTTGGPMTMVTVKLDIYFHCALTGEVIGPRCAMGQAMDHGDKGIYKAHTGAMKSFLRMCALVPDRDEDPEADETVDQFTTGQKPPNGKPAPTTRQEKRKSYDGLSYHERQQNEPINLHQVKAWNDGIRITGKTLEQEAAYLRTKYGIERPHQFTKGQFPAAIRWALGTEPLESTLATSVQDVEAKKGNGKAQPVAEILDRVNSDELEFG